MRKYILVILLLLPTLVYGQDTTLIGHYYCNTALADLDYEIELKSDSTFAYSCTTSWGGEYYNGVWTLKDGIIRLVSHDTTKTIKKYKWIQKIPKNEIRKAKRRGTWSFLVKSRIIYNKNGERIKIIPEFDKSPYLEFIQ